LEQFKQSRLPATADTCNNLYDRLANKASQLLGIKFPFNIYAPVVHAAPPFIKQIIADKEIVVKHLFGYNRIEMSFFMFYKDIFCLCGGACAMVIFIGFSE